MTNDQTHALLYRLQRPFPLVEAPFAAIAEELGITEAEVFTAIADWKQAGKIRRVGGVFDSRRLGYTSCLFAIDVSDDQLEACATEVCALPGVTHAYIRSWPEDFTADGITAADYANYPRFWYTLSEETTHFAETAAKLAHWYPVAFPALRRFKIDVVFDTRTQKRDEQTEHTRHVAEAPIVISPLSEPERALVRALQGDLPVVHDFFAEPVRAAGWDLSKALNVLRTWQANGILRRMSTLLYHRQNGFTANGMCCWKLPEAEIEAAGHRLANDPAVTHCYERPLSEAFPFNLYAMVHQTSWEKAYETYRRLTQEAALPEGRVFFSTREYKKTSLTFFR